MDVLGRDEERKAVRRALEDPVSLRAAEASAAASSSDGDRAATAATSSDGDRAAAAATEALRRRGRPRLRSVHTAARRRVRRAIPRRRALVGARHAERQRDEAARDGDADPHDERGRRRSRGGHLHARLRRARRSGHRVHRGRGADQRERQPPRQRLRRHALHHPRARLVDPRRRGAVRSAARQLRGRGERRLRACARAARSRRKVLGRRVEHAARSRHVGTRGAEPAHVRRRGRLLDRRLRPGARSDPRDRVRAVRGKARREGRLARRRAGLRDALELAGLGPRGRLPLRQDGLLRQLRLALRARRRAAGRRRVALLGVG